MNGDSKKQNQGSRLREWQREHTQAAILAAAKVVLAEDGLTARIDAIAARAGVAVGTLYNHFGDRESLVLAVMDAGRVAVLEALDEVLDAPSSDFSKDLSRFLAVPAEHWRAHGTFVAAVMTEHFNDDQFHSKRQQMLIAVRERARRLVARGVELGEIRPGIEDRSAEHLLTLVRGAMILCALDGRPSPDPADLADFFLHGVAPRAERTPVLRSRMESL